MKHVSLHRGDSRPQPHLQRILASASGDVRDRSNYQTGLSRVDPKACPCMSTRHAASAGVPARRLRAQEADIGGSHGPIDSPDTTTRELQMDVLAKKVAIVTGASSGIGRATARLFAREGARVVVSGRRSAELDALVSDIEAEGGQAIAVPGDIKHEQVAKALVDTAVDRFGGLDVAFNNAGMVGEIKPITEMSLDAWHEMLDTNLASAFLGAKYQVPAMLARGGGSLIFTSSRCAA